MFDVIIIGMGISGISAGIYAKQANLKVLMFESSAPGGLLNNISIVENFAGINSITGPDFAYNLFNQVNDLKVDYKLEKVNYVEKCKDYIKVLTTNGEYKAKNVVIATGRRPKLLSIPGEDKLLGRGLSTCALCDGHFFKDKCVAVVGAGNSALEESLYLSKIVKKVYLLMRRKNFVVTSELIEKVKSCKNIEIMYETYITDYIVEKENLTGLALNNGKIDVSGVFLYVGYEPSTDIFSNLDITNNNGYIEVNENLETKVANIYAIGDVTRKDIYQLMPAASDGARVISKLKL